mgnify:CR=1 FL=1
MTRLILARHGNTFGPGDKIAWVGAKEDLPLVDKGEAQARDLGKALVRAGVKPDRIVTGPLRRTRRAADLVAEFTGFSGAIEIDATTARGVENPTTRSSPLMVKPRWLTGGTGMSCRPVLAGHRAPAR